MIQNVLINSKWLKEFSIYPLNYDTKELENYIKLSESIWIVPAIGEAFYNELLYQVKNDALTEENSTALVEAIYPYLAFAIAYEALPMTWANVTEVGIVKGKSDNADSLSLKDLTLVQDHIRRQLEARKDYCIKWLCERYEIYPLFHNCQCECSCSCGNKASLKTPNPQFQIYSPKRINTNLR